MCRAIISLAAVAALATGLEPARAQWRCDCTTVVARCTAEVTAGASRIDITADTQQCARVDYFVDGLPFVATVVEGRSRLDWMSPRENPDVRVQSCQICADNAARSTATTTDARDAGTAAVRLEPIIRWDAEYPERAQLSGVEGHAVVEFDVMPEGGIANAAVVESEPGELFDGAALEAVRRWRYVADAERPATRLRERLDFSLSDMIWRLQPAAEEPDLGTSAPRNRCIREDAVYNFGEMIEAGLINACSEPLLVYGCAAGVGRQAGRWVCSDSERAGTLLVRPGDTRIGATVQVGEQAQDIAWLTYSDSYFVARAPNSQYWWVACAVADSDCRADARMWTRAVDRQPASINPRGRASIAVARSY